MNGICHTEIPSKDFDKAKKFYGELFGWEFDMMGEGEYMIFKTPDGPGGGFDKSSEISSKPGLIIYVEVEDIENTIKNAEGLGGKCVRGKTQISPEFGYFAILDDIEGNQLGIWSKN